MKSARIGAFAVVLAVAAGVAATAIAQNAAQNAEKTSSRVGGSLSRDDDEGEELTLSHDRSELDVALQRLTRMAWLSDSVLNQLRGGTEYSAILSHADHPLLDQASVVVEMTPYYREQFHPAWTLARVQSVTGRQVKVTGQLMIDNVHHIPKDDCGLGDAGHQQMLARVDVGSSSGHQFPGLQRGLLRRQFHELGKFGRDVSE